MKNPNALKAYVSFNKPEPQKKTEGIARVEIDARELHDAAAAEEDHRLQHDFVATPDQWDAQRRVQLVGGENQVAHVPDARAVHDAQTPVSRPHRPRLVNSIERDHDVLQPTLRCDARQQQTAEHEGEADVERVIAGVDGRESDDDGEEDKRRADAGQSDHAIELPRARDRRGRHDAFNAWRAWGIPSVAWLPGGSTITCHFSASTSCEQGFRAGLPGGRRGRLTTLVPFKSPSPYDQLAECRASRRNAGVPACRQQVTAGNFATRQRKPATHAAPPRLHFPA